MGSSLNRIVIVGAGHNGLVAATLLARAGRSVVVLERGEDVGGAAVSGMPFAGVGARLSRYAYLVSLFPEALWRDLGLRVELRSRRIASYTPQGDHGLLVDRDGVAARASMAAIAGGGGGRVGGGGGGGGGGGCGGGVGGGGGGGEGEYERWVRFYAMTARVAERVFPTLTEPLRSREEMRRLVGDDEAWEALFERPLSAVLERTFTSDLVRGVVLTDATIGTFAPADDPELRQNRCFLYHVIGNGTGQWDVPVGGMGAVTDALARAARDAGVEIRTRAEVTAVQTDGATAAVRCADGTELGCEHVLAGVAPAVLARLLGDPAADDPAADDPAADDPTADDAGGPAPPEGAQLKVNMLLRRLPRLRDAAVSREDAFAGTFHVNEGYAQLDAAFRAARAVRLPDLVPCELYCHSLTDPTILDEELRATGAQTLTVFALHMPARLFGDPGAKDAALAATLRSINSVLAEPIEDCLYTDAEGRPCLEAVTPLELESQLAMPGGHIFHRDLTWPFAESDDEIGTWGVETDHPNVWLCGAGARRGGGVSGVPGHNVARAVLDRR